MKQIRILALGLLGAGLVSGAALAGTESGFYLGAGVGQASVGDISPPDGSADIDFSGDATGYKIFAGYNFGWVPFLDLAVEGGYVDFGNSDDEFDGARVEVDPTGWDLFALVGGNIGPVGVFGKAGVINWDGDVSVEGLGSEGDDGTDPAYGVGARLKFGSVEVRAEYEIFDIDVADVDMISLSGAWTF